MFVIRENKRKCLPLSSSIEYLFERWFVEITPKRASPGYPEYIREKSC
jgi:hypothetical protein